VIVLTPEQSKSLAVKVLEGSAVAIVGLIVSGSLLWARHRVNAKVAADERCAVAQERIADSLESKSTISSPEYPSNKLDTLSHVKIMSPSNLLPCPKNESYGPDYPDYTCEVFGSARRCWNGKGVSVWITPGECKNWYLRTR
jgi:hypothetical protein